MKRTIILALIIGAAFGCKKGPVVVVKDPGPAQPVQGAKIATSSDGSVSIAVMPGWKRGTPDSFLAPTLGESMFGSGDGPSSEYSGVGGSGAGTESSDPTAAPPETAELEAKGILLWVNDSSRPIPGEERTSYRVKRKDDGPKSLEDAVEEAKQSMLKEGPVQYVDLPIGKAGRLEAKTTKIDGGELYEIVYIVVNGEHTYNIRFATQNSPTSIQSIEKDAINSLRIKPAKA